MSVARPGLGEPFAGVGQQLWQDPSTADDRYEACIAAPDADGAELTSGSRHPGRVMAAGDALTLWHAAGPEDLALVEASGWRQFARGCPGSQSSIRCHRGQRQ